MEEMHSGWQLKEDQMLLREGIVRFPAVPGEKPQLVASKCDTCGDIAFPKKIRCGKCDGKTMKDVLLSSRGKLYAHTIVRQAVPGYEVPNILGVVKVPEDDELLIMAQIRECSIEEVVNGMEVETVIVELYTDYLRNKRVVGYAFRPVR
ncbi:MAG: OB-fold domain-containing protein [Desulfobacterales bacterium]